jgi:guanine deaminase
MNPEFMREAIRLSLLHMREGRGGPFGAVVVRGEEIIGRGWNQVTSANDPTAHAEIVAIRQACKRLRDFNLQECELYTSCEPCPMCLAAVYWARIPRLYYGNTRRDAARIAFDDALIYRELGMPIRRRKLIMRPLLRDEALEAFKEWERKIDKVLY